MKLIAKKRVRESVLLSNTQASRAVNYSSYAPHSMWFKGKEMISQNLDECAVGSWIFANSQVNVSVILLQPENIVNIMTIIASHNCLSYTWYPSWHCKQFLSACGWCIPCLRNSPSYLWHAHSCTASQWGWDSNNSRFGLCVTHCKLVLPDPPTECTFYIQCSARLSACQMHCIWTTTSEARATRIWSYGVIHRAQCCWLLCDQHTHPSQCSSHSKHIASWVDTASCTIFGSPSKAPWIGGETQNHKGRTAACCEEEAGWKKGGRRVCCRRKRCVWEQTKEAQSGGGQLNKWYL